MSSGPQSSRPRHMARRRRRPGPIAPAPEPRSSQRQRVAPVEPVKVNDDGHELAEVPPVARIKRSRLAFAAAVTMAALPILVLDNLPATAASADRPTGIERVAVRDAAPASSTTTAPVVDQAPTTTSVAPTTTEGAPAPTSTSTTAAPTTTTAPAAPVTLALVGPPAQAAPAPAPPPAARSAGPASPHDSATWDRLARCESGGNWSINTGNGYYGGLQFSKSTWDAYGGTGYPHQASKATQIAIGQRLHAVRGWDAWPGCARILGLNG